jgi:hypothetical protein
LGGGSGGGGGGPPVIGANVKKLGPQGKDHYVYPRENKESTYKYFRRAKFPFMQLAILPPLLYQTRFRSVPCSPETFAGHYDVQKDRQELPYFGMNAPREGNLLVCVDRDPPMSTLAYDPLIETDGVLFPYSNETVYAKFVMDGLAPLTSLIRKQWIDTQTRKVVLATMIYTQELEVYTIINVEFTISSTGRITAVPSFRSIVDLNDSGGITTYTTYMVVAVISAVFSALAWFYECWGGNKENYSLVGVVQLLSPVSVFSLLAYIYTIVPTLEPMSHEYELLLGTFLEIPELTRKHLLETTTNFFSINTVVEKELNWVSTVRMLGFVSIMMQFTQLNLLMRVHPRIAVLARTLVEGFDDTFHFLLLFGIIFGILAFVAWWTFGATIGSFNTVGVAAQRQFEMVIGEYPWDTIEGLPFLTAVMYTIYLLTYSILAFFILVNFFLAIVVDAFLNVKKGIINQVTENSSPFDTMDIPVKLFLYSYNRFPPRRKILNRLLEEEEIDHLQKLVDDNKEKLDPSHGEVEYQGLVDVDALCKLSIGFTAQSAEKFLQIYHATIPDLEFEKYDQDNQRIMLEDLKDTMNKRAAILNQMRYTEPDIESKKKENDIGALQLSVSLLDQEIGKKQKELEFRTHDLMQKQKQIRELKRKLLKLGIEPPENGANGDFQREESAETRAPSNGDHGGLGGLE